MNNKGDSQYFDLIETLEKDPGGFDYQQLRVLYPKTSLYDPYSSDTASLKLDMFASFENCEYEKGAEEAEQILAQNYLDMDAHLALSRFYWKNNEDEKSDFHNLVLSRLLQAVKESGDGRSFETAFKVLCTDEEYFVTAHLGCRVISQSLQGGDEHKYDVLTVESGPDNKQENIYFSIDIPFGWLNKKMQNSKE